MASARESGWKAQELDTADDPHIDWKERPWARENSYRFDIDEGLKYFNLFNGSLLLANPQELLMRIFKAAISQNKIEVARECLSLDLTIEMVMHFRCEYGATLLHHAMAQTHASPDWIRFLCNECHIDPTALDQYEASALHTAVDVSPIFDASPVFIEDESTMKTTVVVDVAARKLACTRELLKRCPELYDLRDLYGNAALHDAFYTPIIFEYLCAYPQQAQIETGYAGYYRDSSQFVELLNRINLETGQTLLNQLLEGLHWNYVKEELACVLFGILLEYGIDLSPPPGQTSISPILQLEMLEAHAPERCTRIGPMLRKWTKPTGSTPIIYDTEVFNQLRRYLACEENSELQTLLTAQPQLITACRDKVGNSILACAVYRRNRPLIEWLLQQGVELWIENKYQQTPLHAAFLIRAGEISALLYHYEKQIRNNPMAKRNDDSFIRVFMSSPDPRAMSEVTHKRQIKIFNETMEALSRSGVKLPEATHRIAIDVINSLEREADSAIAPPQVVVSPSPASGLRHRGGGGGEADPSTMPMARVLAVVPHSGALVDYTIGL